MTCTSVTNSLLKRGLAVIFLFAILSSISPSSYAQSDLDQIDKYLSEARNDWGVPGMAVAIVKDGKILLAKGYGFLEDGKKKKVDEHSMFAIASNTKAFISAALATLVDQGKLSWDDKVVQHLPYFRLYDPYVTQNTTIRDILSHRTGLGTFSGDVIWYKSTLSAEEVVKKASMVPQAYSFRSGYGYSNLMFITAGEVIKSVTGKSWDEYIKATFFTPLNMDRTVTSVSALNTIDNVASPHKPRKDKNTPLPYVNWDNMGAAGGIISNVDDMAQWMMLHLNNGILGSDTLFAPDTQADMWTPHNSYKVGSYSKKLIPSKHFSGYGLGWGLSDYKGKMMVTHGGGYDGMYSKVTLIPDENIGIVVLTNTMKGISTPITMWVIDNLLNDQGKDWSAETLKSLASGPDYRQERINKRLVARTKDTNPSLPLQKFTGTFRDPKYGDIVVDLDGTTLRLNFKTSPTLNASLSHWHFNTFKIEWDQEHAWFDFGTVLFEMDNNNQVQNIKFDVPNDDIFFDELELNKVK